MNIKECFEKELLRKGVPDLERSRRSVASAEHKLENAQTVFEVGVYEDAIIDAYTAMFHASRALLFKDGIEERSHYGVYIYLCEKYGGKIEQRFLNELNALRMERHKLMYDTWKSPEIKEVEAENIIKVASEFVESVKKYIPGVEE